MPKKLIISMLLLMMPLAIAIEEPSVLVVGSLPDQHFLYFFKTKINEPIKLLFSKDELQYNLELLELRKEEMKALAEKIKDSDKLTKYQQKAEELRQKHLKAIEEKSQELNEDDTKKLNGILQKHIDRLNEILEKAPESAKSGLRNAIESSSKVLDKTKERFKEEPEKEEANPVKITQPAKGTGGGGY